jgi:polyribonucleotide nucleotidyltransferase
MQKKEYSIEIGGKTLTAEFNDLSNQADGSVLLRYGNTVVLATVVMSPKEGDSSYFPLTVDYEEKFYAAGQILGSRFMRREGKPSDEAVLSARIVDRTIRPLFNKYIRNDIQVIITVLSIEEDDPDILAVNAASLAIATSDIPWNGPVSAVRIIKDAEKWTINPSYSDRKEDISQLEVVACGKDGNINMIEVAANEYGEADIVTALEKASDEIEKLQDFQKKIVAEMGKEKRKLETPEMSDELIKLFEENVAPKMNEAVFSGPGKESMKNLESEWKDLVKTKLPDEAKMAMDLYEEKLDELIHKEAIDNDRRPDGRKMSEVRPLYAKAGGLSPVLHGSGIFYRGETHVLSVLTLGGPQDSQIIDGMELQTKKKFMHHYNFPPFSVGETGRLGGFNRRMIGHGALAEKALLAVMPPKEKFPYTVRVVSECMASNGSTSMASVCAGTLALLDAGVPIKAPVAGIASGLMMRKNSQGKGENDYEYKILTDIQGPEDHHGDMDLKVAGTKEGVTAIQMDVKVEGVPIYILKEALDEAKKARLHILKTIEEEIKEPRPEISPNAPKIVVVNIKPDQIGMVIGPGGKMINEIRDLTGAEIEIEDDGTVFITGKNGSAEKAQVIIEAMTREYKVGEEYDGTVAKITEFGAFVKIGPSTDGLVHISEIAPYRVDNVSDILKEGDVVPVVIKGVDEKQRLSLSIKRRDPDFAKRHSNKNK